MREISVFVDESGGQDGRSRYYALTLVFHDQDRPIDEMVARHRKGLRDRGLEDLPFHAGPILNGHKEYENMDFTTRKSYFMLFFLTLQHLPVAYQTFVYRRSEVGGKDAFVNRMRRDITDLLFERLEYFQSFDKVKLYYDDGKESAFGSKARPVGNVARPLWSGSASAPGRFFQDALLARLE